MATMNISVPDPMKDWVQAQIDGGTLAPATMCGTSFEKIST